MGVAAHAVNPELQRVFAEDLPQLAYAEVATMDAPLFAEFREFLTRSTAGIGDPELAMWMVATVANAVIHRAVVERPEDLSKGSIRDELVALLVRHLNGFRQGAGHSVRKSASPEQQCPMNSPGLTPRRSRKSPVK
jgi:hypothetical protein